MIKKQKQQRGGTVIGFIVGIIVGLGAALAVALYVTNVPVPFMNKGATRGANQDAQESDKNKDWDPNSPLYGKNPARPASAAASGAVQTATPTPPAEPASAAPAPVTTPAAKPAVAASAPDRPSTVATPARTDEKPAVSSDPLGDLARAKAGGASVDPFDYFVQAGAFRTAEDADAQRAKLAMMGWEAKVSEREQAGRTVFRVRVGPFGKRDDAERIKEKFDASGVESALVRVQR